MKAPLTLAQVIASLPEEERFILTLHYLRSMPPAEIAELEAKLSQLVATKNTLANQIKILDSQTQLTILKISQTEQSVGLLEKQITLLVSRC